MVGDESNVQPLNGAPDPNIRRDRAKESRRKIRLSPASLVFLLLVSALLSAGAVALVAYLTGAWTNVSQQPIELCSNQSDEHGGQPEDAAATTDSGILPDSVADKEYRLPSTLKPLEYRMKMKVYMPSESVTFEPEKNFTYDINLEIRIACLGNTNTVTLHQINLQIDEDSVYLSQNGIDGGLGLVKPNKIVYRNDVEMVDFIFGTQIKAGEEYLLKMVLTGSIPDNRNDGFYLSTYHENGTKRYVAATNLQPANCRRIFPLFDEPQLKAVYKLTVIHPRGLRAISNAHSLSENHSAMVGWKPSLNAHHSCPVIYLPSLFPSSNTLNKRLLAEYWSVRVWARPETVDKLEFAANYAVKCVEFLEGYFDMDYPLDKLDLIALPDFGPGAMENWGMVAFRELYIVLDPKSTTDAGYGYALAAQVIAHETAHMWFGNLVTMKWWDDLWLNEAFAVYMEGIIIDSISGNRFHHEDRSLARLKLALTNDAMPGTHPVIVEGLSRPDDVVQLFSQTSFIPYSKGSYLLRMLHKVLGDDVMRQGLSIYLQTYKFSNADHNDLWRSLTEAVLASNSMSPVNVTQFMETWTLQMNYPVILVETCQNGSVSVRQERFRTDATQPESLQFSSPFGYKWQVPLWHIQSNRKEEQLQWLQLQPKDASATLSVALPVNGWILLNSGWKGYYRVQYSNELWQKLSQQLWTDHTVIPMRNRAQLLDDAFALADAGRLNFETALDLASYLQKEEHSLVWTTAFEKFDKLNNLFMATPAYGDFMHYMRKMLDSIYQKYAWRDDLMDDGILQITLARDASLYPCKYGHKACLSQTRAFIIAVMHKCRASNATTSSDCNNINPVWRSGVYCAAVSSSDDSVWEFVWEKYKLEQNPAEKRRLMVSLTCTKEPWLIQRLLTEAMFGTHFRLNTLVFVYTRVIRHANGRLGVWKFFENNFDKLHEKYGKLSGEFGFVIEGSMTMTNTPADVEQLKRFYANHHQLQPFKSIVDKQIGLNEVGSAWLQANYEPLAKWFREH